uniref:Uncharacterized protein n=1 Tax=Pyrodinium bahamense TaxID=73915 RepID=A0A7S0FA69_9DINO|mmetsp:Transcript_1703/g.4659  ORF Transcript_1703/g.4659 Transcript_1703/m.4659 type:complete len:286 (+) Transcript_1703:125-982(+)
MGNTALQNKGCCCSSNDDIHAVMDMVTPQQLTQGIFKDFRAVPEAEEEVEMSRDREKRGAAAGDAPLRKRLLTAVRQDDAPGVLQYVADGADVVDMGEALRLAAHRGSAAVVRELVAVGICVNDGCPHTGFTPLQLAAASGHIVVCELLLDALADVHRPIGGATALSLARKMGNVEVEEVIERHVASLLLQDQGEGGEEAAQYRRAHVLPRVSPVLSEAVLQALPAPPPSGQQDVHEVEEEEEAPGNVVEEDPHDDGDDSAESSSVDLPGQDCDSAQALDRVLPL